MGNKTSEIREKYREGAIFKTGSIVEDIASKEKLKIIDRGANHLVLETSKGKTIRKWLHEVSELAQDIRVQKESEFVIEDSQIKMFGYKTKNFDSELSQMLIEQFEQFTDTYSKHQIVKLLDKAMYMLNLDESYDALEKVSEFYAKKEVTEPFIVEGLKNDVERKRICEIIAAIAGVKPSDSPYKTISDSITALKAKYQSKKQWEVMMPVFQLAQDAGIMGVTSRLPFNFGQLKLKEETEDEIIWNIFEEHIDLIVEELTLDVITEAFIDEEFSDEYLSEEQLDEVLSVQTRQHMGFEMRKREAPLEQKRLRALVKPASADVLLSRARKMALSLLKFKMFKKPSEDLTRQEKERFEAGAAKRKALVARLAQRLVAKVRVIQNDRIKSQNALHPGHKKHSDRTGSGLGAD